MFHNNSVFLISVFETTAMLKIANLQYFPLAPFARSRVTDEALIAETAVWPNFFLLNIFFVLKGSKHLLLFPIHTCHKLGT